MSVIDRVLQGQEAEKAAMTLRQAAATVLVAAVTSDDGVAPQERTRLIAQLSTMRIYRQASAEDLQAIMGAATAAVAQYGTEELLTACATAIPEELRAAIFALAVELVFVDGRVTEREKRFVDALQAALEIDDATAMSVVRVLLIKSRA